MRRIVLDTTTWKSQRDFYEAVLPALEAPSWHGWSLDALWDSIGIGDINGLRPPYTIHLTGRARLPPELHDHIGTFMGLIEEAQSKGVEVSATADPALCLQRA